MNDWRTIMKKAEEARCLLIANEREGIVAFNRLLADFPADGMIFLKRGLGYESLGQFENAVSDLERAKALLPMPRWISTADTALDRVRRRINVAGADNRAPGEWHS
jgi:tetratricopeptide (TPR) repeat protein